MKRLDEILPEVRRRLETSLITNDKDTTLMITERSVSTLFLCNHEDSQLVLHATEMYLFCWYMLMRSWNQATIGL